VRVPGMIVNNNSRAANSDSIASPGVALFVENHNNEIESEAHARGGANEEQEVVAHAVMVEDPSNDEHPREELPYAKATPLVPLYKQKRVWFGGVAVLGAFVTLIVIFLRVVGNQPPTPPAPTSAMPSLSLVPSSSFIPSMFPSVSPSSNEYSQLKALVQISNVFASEDWAKNDGWGSTSSNMCIWYGVVCDTDGVDSFVTELNLASNNLTGDIDDITMFGNLIYLEQLDLDSNSIVGNLTEFSLNLIQFSNLKYVDLRFNNLTGSIPSEVCDSMEGVDLRVDCGIECDCCNHEVLCEEECMDVPGWHDSDSENYDCAWYESFFYCEELGSCCENDGHTANTACCDCGGGIRGFKSSPSSAPSSIPSQSTTPSVSQQPSITPSHRPTLSQQPSVSMQPTTLYKLQQRGALVALYDATNGDEWRINTNWQSDAPVCEWYGLDCNNDDDVIEIHLYYNTLRGSIPSELGLLTNLEDLYLYYNSLTGSIPSELGLLTNLQSLYLDGNSLTGSIPSELGLLNNLEGLGLYRNSLTGTLPNEVCALRNDNVGNLGSLSADCEEVTCPCCTLCCVDGGGCSFVT